MVKQSRTREYRNAHFRIANRKAGIAECKWLRTGASVLQPKVTGLAFRA
jgi:hypothetical protein